MKILLSVLAFLMITNYGIAQNQLINIDVGEKVPDITIEDISDASFTSGSLRQLSKDKLLILDFWATWCAPCVHAFPRLDSLVNEFPDELQVITVTSQSSKEVRDFLENRKKNGLYASEAPKVMADSTLNKLFPHRVIPHYAWIRNGEVMAITEEVNKEDIVIALDGEYPTSTKKVDETTAQYNRRKTPLIEFLSDSLNGRNGNRAETYSMLTRFLPELGHSGGYSSIRDYRFEKNMRVTATNLNLVRLYRMAYGKMKTFINDGAIDILSIDSMVRVFDVSGMAARRLIEKRAFCYEVVAPEDVVFEKMQQDLTLAFPEFTAEIVKAVDTCLVLEKINDNIENYVVDFEKTPFNNFSDNCMEKENTLMSGLRTALEGFVFRYSKYPVVDHTGFEKRFNITLCGNLSDLNELNKALVPYGLQMAKKKVSHSRLVISDR